MDAQHFGALPMLFGTLDVGRRLVASTCGPDAPERLADLGAHFRASVLSFARGEGPGWEPFGDQRSSRVFSLLGDADGEDRDVYRSIRNMLPA